MSHCDLLDILCVNIPSHILNLFTKAFHNCYKCGSQTPCPLRLLPLLIAKLLFEQKIRVGFAETLSALRSHPFKQDELWWIWAAPFKMLDRAILKKQGGKYFDDSITLLTCSLLTITIIRFVVDTRLGHFLLTNPAVFDSWSIFSPQ